SERRWLLDLARWDQEVKPQLIELRRTLDAVPLTELSDDELLAHVRRCADAYREGFRQHHEFTFPCLLPIGDFVLSGMQWTGAGASELLRTLGASEVTQGGAAELAALAAAIRGN